MWVFFSERKGNQDAKVWNKNRKEGGRRKEEKAGAVRRWWEP
jgi:hypothetical protein